MLSKICVKRSCQLFVVAKCEYTSQLKQIHFNIINHLRVILLICDGFACKVLILIPFHLFLDELEI
jgi:hypothetical protein